jgi:predicted small secreted protein
MLKQIAALAVLAGCLIAAAGCNTIEGAGRDVKATGQAIEKAAGSAKSK